MNRKERRAGRTTGANSAFGAAGTGMPGAASAADLFRGAVAHHQAGALDEAERQYRRVLLLAPTHANSLENLGLIALQKGDAKAAAALFAKALAINDRSAAYHYNAALAYRALNRIDEVAAHLQRAIELRSDYDLAHLNLGNVRRDQGRLPEAILCYERAVVLNPNLPASHFNLGNVLAGMGQLDRAIACYRQVLTLVPNHADTHHSLGAALATQGHIGEAVGFFERAAMLKPESPYFHEDLAKAYMLAGKPERAIDAARHALERGETEQNKALFARCAKNVLFNVDDGRNRPLLLRALTEAWDRPRELSRACTSLVKVNPAVAVAIAHAQAAWPTRLGAAELCDAPGIAALAKDELLCRLLEYDPVTEVGLERLLTNVRHHMLVTADEHCDGTLLGFYCAVARQCFINDYVFALTESEAERLRQLRARLEAALAARQRCPVVWPVVIAAYLPLHSVPNAELLLQNSWPPPVQALLIQQIEEPAQERQIAATIPVLTAIDDEVSRNVRRQYEENPYPRWTKPGPPQQPSALNTPTPTQTSDVLIAGCGTGLSTIELARQVLHSRILAVDLSLASLSYAKRMAQDLDVTNVEFAQADILNLASIDRSFDFIDASGVLHHLADPWQGWRVLLALLRPGGVMQVGLYSRQARHNVVAARALIAERGYRSVADDIRRCRQEIIESADPLLKSLVQWGDFFTTSECRDLLFHVQEHQIAIPEIKSFLAANNASFNGFALPPHTMQKFAEHFPNRGALTDLDCWHEFEIRAPDTFVAMYQFWVSKPAALRAD